MTTQAKIDAEARTLKGKSSCSRARKAGKVPAVVYSKHMESTPIMLERSQLNSTLIGGVIELHCGGKVSEVMIKDMQFHPVNDELLHMDLIAVKQDEPTTISVSCKFINHLKSPGIKCGGILNIIMRQIKLIGKPKDLPKSLEIDLAGLGIGDFIITDQLNLPEGVQVAKMRGANRVANIIGRRSLMAAAQQEEQSSENTA